MLMLMYAAAVRNILSLEQHKCGLYLAVALRAGEDYPRSRPPVLIRSLRDRGDPFVALSDDDNVSRTLTRRQEKRQARRQLVWEPIASRWRSGSHVVKQVCKFTQRQKADHQLSKELVKLQDLTKLWIARKSLTWCLRHPNTRS